MQGVAVTAAGPYRHVVFTSAARRPWNLGLPAAAPLAQVANATPRSDEIDVTSSDDAFLSWVLSENGQSARDYRLTSLRRRLPACLRALKVKTTSDARRLLGRCPQLLPAAHDTLVLGVTEFFRDPPVFAALAERLPAALAASGGGLRVWSVGCSKGAELYSVAMLLAELNALQSCDLLGTDCRADAVARAGAGWYSQAVLRGVPHNLMNKYFTQSGDASAARFAIDPSLRERVAWRQCDALAGADPGPWDLILCRNFIMYLQPQAAEKVYRGLVSALRPGGLLVLGKAERPVGVAGLVPAGPCFYRRYGEP